MKIGIITLPLHTNYGGILQAYALQTVLQRMGHEVYIIEEENNVDFSLTKKFFIYSKRLINKIRGSKFPFFYEQKQKKEQPIIRQHINRFINQHINIKSYKKFKDIKENDFDAIIVGSDQVWRPKYFGQRKIYNAFLDFTKDWNIKRYAYAASFGTDLWEYNDEQTQKCSDLVKTFNAVSVREDSAVDLCSVKFHIIAKHVLDPTMLLSKEDYINLFKLANTPKSSGTLLNYILDETPEKIKLIEDIEKETKLIPFRINASSDTSLNITNRIQPSIEQWIRGFYDAEFIVTDSFHACVFSIIFQKPFICIGNKDRGLSRFTSLLKYYNLEHNLLDSTNLNQYKSFIKFSKPSVLINTKDSLNFLNTL